jgi:prepilin-type processing-associated H-X9-DG protein
MLHYLSHPRLMPQYGQKTGLTLPNGQQEALLVPYQVGRIKRAPEIAMIFDAPLYYDSSAYGIWKLKFELPVANGLDRNALTAKAPFLLDNYAGTTVDPGSSIDLTSAGGFAYPPNQDNFGNTGTIRFRHMRDTMANALMADGHVESFRYDPRKKPDDPLVSNFLRRNVYVNKQ